MRRGQDIPKVTPSARIQGVQSPIIPVVGEMIRAHPGRSAFPAEVAFLAATFCVWYGNDFDV